MRIFLEKDIYGFQAFWNPFGVINPINPKPHLNSLKAEIIAQLSCTIFYMASVGQRFKSFEIDAEGRSRNPSHFALVGDSKFLIVNYCSKSLVDSMEEILTVTV